MVAKPCPAFDAKRKPGFREKNASKQKTWSVDSEFNRTELRIRFRTMKRRALVKNWWRKWSYEIPLAFGDALWEVLVVQFAAFSAG